MKAYEGLRPRQIDLLDRLEALFFAEGYRRATMADLARRLRCSKRALYELAPSRKELFCVVIERWSYRLQAQGTTGAAAHESPDRRLVAYLKPAIAETRRITPAFLTDLQGLPEAKVILERHQLQRIIALKAIVEDGTRSGLFSKIRPGLVSAVFLAAIDLIGDTRFLDDEDFSYSQAFEQLYQWLVKGLIV